MGGSKPSKFENNETYQNVKDLGLERKSNYLTIKLGKSLNSKRKIRFVCISDTHNTHSFIDIPPGDVLIHAGDITFHNKGGSKEINDFNTWLGDLPHEYKVVIGGNHDYCLSKHKIEKCQNKILTNATYLCNSSVTIHGIKIYGAPWHRYRGIFYFASAYGLDEKKVEEEWQKIPDDTDILITHVPPFGILDYGMGSYELLNHVLNRVCPKVHVFGHCHDRPGIKQLKITKHNRNNVLLKSEKLKHKITFINASQAIGDPKVFDYEIEE